MSRQHRGPLIAFLTVAVLCILLVGRAVRSEALDLVPPSGAVAGDRARDEDPAVGDYPGHPAPTPRAVAVDGDPAVVAVPLVATDALPESQPTLPGRDHGRDAPVPGPAEPVVPQAVPATPVIPAVPGVPVVSDHPSAAPQEVPPTWSPGGPLDEDAPKGYQPDTDEPQPGTEAPPPVLGPPPPVLGPPLPETGTTADPVTSAPVAPVEDETETPLMPEDSEPLIP